MKIQINAAQRLKAETDRVEMARSYLESLGVEVGALESQSRTLIEFMIPYTSFDLVKGKLIKKLGRPQDINSQEPDTHLRWTIKGKGFVILYRNEYKGRRRRSKRTYARFLVAGRQGRQRRQGTPRSTHEANQDV